MNNVMQSRRASFIMLRQQQKKNPVSRLVLCRLLSLFSCACAAVLMLLIGSFFVVEADLSDLID